MLLSLYLLRMWYKWKESGLDKIVLEKLAIKGPFNMNSSDTRKHLLDRTVANAVYRISVPKFVFDF